MYFIKVLQLDAMLFVNVFSTFTLQNPVGPGRYDIQKWDESQPRNGHTSVFKSKTTKLDAKREKFLQ